MWGMGRCGRTCTEKTMDWPNSMLSISREKPLASMRGFSKMAPPEVVGSGSEVCASDDVFRISLGGARRGGAATEARGGGSAVAASSVTVVRAGGSLREARATPIGTPAIELRLTPGMPARCR